MVAPLVIVAISPTEDDNPPAPLSVSPLIKPFSWAAITKSMTLFWVKGSPICTAVTGEPSCRDSEENVAP